MGGESSSAGGGGGVCNSGPGKTVELFDYYEARTVTGLKQDLGPDHLSIEEKVQLIISRIGRFNPHRQKRYANWATTFFEEAAIISGIVLEPIDDSDRIFLPKGCDYQQVAAQQRAPLPGQKRYFINGDLWNLMNDNNKVGIVVHELIHREAAFEMRHSSSRLSRYFHSVIASKEVELYTPKMWREFVFVADFVRDPLVVYGVRFNNSEGEFHPNGWIAWGMLSDPQALPLYNGERSGTFDYYASFYENGTTRKGRLRETSVFQTVDGRSLRICGVSYPILEFNKEGLLEKWPKESEC